MKGWTTHTAHSAVQKLFPLLVKPLTTELILQVALADKNPLPPRKGNPRRDSEGWQKILFYPNPAACYLPKLANRIQISSLYRLFLKLFGEATTDTQTPL